MPNVLQYVSLGLMLILTYLVSSNNLSLVAGIAVGSRLVRPEWAMLMALVGFVVGLVTQGSEMRGYAVSSQLSLLIMASVGILVFLVGELTKVPMSITNSLYMSWSALVLYARGSLPMNFPLVLASWLITPVILAVAAYFIYIALTAVSRNNNPLSMVSLYRFMVLVMVFLVGYSFGANNLGLIWSMMGFGRLNLTALVLASTMGVVITGRRTLGSFSRGIYIPPPLSGAVTQFLSFMALEVSTFFSIPITLTLCTLGSLLGVSMARGMRILNRQYIELVIMGYAVTMIISFTLALITVRLLA